MDGEPFEAPSVGGAMVDVRLLYPPEKTEPASRLAEAIGGAGYRVEREALADGRAFPDVPAEAGKAKVLILIWSRGLVSVAMEGTRLASARRQANLIEVSADGIEPAGAEPSPVVLLCGWRGQPYHQGWQRILAEIGRQCGSREAAGKSRRTAASAVAGRGTAAASSPGRRPLRSAVAAGALLAAIVGAGAVYERTKADPAPNAQARPAIAVLGEAPPAPATGAPPPILPPAPALSPAPAPAAVMPATPAPAPGSVAEPAPAAVRVARPRPAATAERRNPPRLAAASGREVKRYSRKNSKTMRLFCQRSGRSTPQCRTFARSMREADG